MSLKVFLNCFPPTSLYMPSIGCEVLNNYISKHNNIEGEVIYWNHIFQYKKNNEENLFQSDIDLYQLLPFLAILAKQNSPEIINRILLKMQECNPSFKTLGENYYKLKLSKQIEQIHETIENQINYLPDEDPFIFGVSAKFDSWISGLVVALEIKKKRSNSICILGGIEEESAAEALFRNLNIFDFAIWGEGEIPLSLLIEKLLNNEEDYEGIPRLLFKTPSFKPSTSKAGEIVDKSSFLNLNNYLDINYNSYFKYAKEISKESIQFPIETSRGCRWNKCRFCALSWGNLYRTQDINNVVNQIKKHYLEYEVIRYFFVDNDIVGKNIRLFEEFLDKLINLSTELEVDFDFHADILHLNFNKKIIRKLSLAGFKSVQIGYEGVSDSMLKKLNKSTTFADNLLFIKFAQKYDIEITISGLIIGIPNENETDIYESTNNLHFLRFFLGKRRKELQHTLSKLVLFYKTQFWEMATDREKFNINILNDFFPKDFIEDDRIAYSLFGQWTIPPLMEKWESFKKVSDYYEKHEFSYYLMRHNGIVNYLEYRENLKIESLSFDQPEYWDVLKLANDQVITLKEIDEKLSSKYKGLKAEKIKEIIDELKGSYLLYCSKDYKKIVSIIDTDRL